MQINTTLLTEEEKEFLEKLKGYLHNAKFKAVLTTQISTGNQLVDKFIYWQATVDINQIESEINILEAKAEYRADLILELCHTGK